MTALLVLLIGAPVFDSFTAPPDPNVWYIGVPPTPAKGWLTIPKSGWLVSRGVPDEGVEKIEVVFRHKGGDLEVAFFTQREPLSSPQGAPLVIPKGKGVRTLVITPTGATVDGAALDWKGLLRGTFRLRAVKGAVAVDEVSVAPRFAEPRLSLLEAETVHFATTPIVYRNDGGAWTRRTLMLWDCEVCFLLRRGAPAFAALRAPVKGAPVLGALVTGGDAKALALKASTSRLAMRDWSDEQRNMSRGAFLRYLQVEYALFSILLDAQRALNAAIPERNDLEPLVHLAAIRHSPNAHAAVALAQTQGAKGALAALRKALGGTDPGRASGDALRQAAEAAARAILGEPPAAWPGFAFKPGSRYVTIQQAKELASG